MGVAEFFKIVVSNEKSNYAGKTIADIGNEVNLDNLAGKKIAIDASGIIYNSLTAFNQIATLTDKNGDPTGHLVRIINLALSLRTRRIKQYWVFDSPKQTPLKADTNKKRNAARAAAAAKGDTRSAFKITGKLIEDVKKLLLGMGIPIFQAPDEIEGEKYAAILTKNLPGSGSFCDYVMSADSDVLMFGGNLLRYSSQKSATGKSKKTVYKIYMLKDLLDELGCTYDELIQSCVALGTDFNPKTARIGPTKVIEKVQYAEIEFTDVQKAAMNYIKQNVVIEMSDLKVEDFNEDSVVKFLHDKGFAEKTISKVVENFSDTTQFQ